MAISTKTGPKTKKGFKKGLKPTTENRIKSIGYELKNIKGVNPDLAQYMINSVKKYYKAEGIGRPKGSPTITKDNSKAGLSKKSKKKDS